MATRMSTTNDTHDDVQYVIDELLTYVFHNLKRHPADCIKSVILDFYCAEAINEAKRKLWDAYPATLPAYEKRTNKGLKTASEKEIDDIIKSAKVLDSAFSDKTLPVTFVAVNLDQIPDVKPGEAESFSLLERVKRLENQMAKVCAIPAELTYASVTTPKVKATSNSLSDGKQNACVPPILTVALPPENSRKPMMEKMAPTDSDGFMLQAQQRKAYGRQQRRDGKAKPKVVYGTKSDTTIRAGPRRHELFVFRVHSDIKCEEIKQFLRNENVVVNDLELVSKQDAWTNSYRVVVETADLDFILKPDFWPDGIGCRKFWRKRAQ